MEAHLLGIVFLYHRHSSTTLSTRECKPPEIAYLPPGAVVSSKLLKQLFDSLEAHVKTFDRVCERTDRYEVDATLAISSECIDGNTT